MPTLTLIAGPNGSGKSTLTRTIGFEGRERLLDPDAIARELNPFNPSAAAIAAGRAVLTRTAEYLDRRVDFAVETTLSSSHWQVLIQNAKSRGFAVHLIFVALETPERNVARVKDRAALGGHFVPEPDVRRRYAKSLRNAGLALHMVDLAKLYDNSGNDARLVLIARCGVIVWRVNPLPTWVCL